MQRNIDQEVKELQLLFPQEDPVWIKDALLSSRTKEQAIENLKGSKVKRGVAKKQAVDPAEKLSSAKRFEERPREAPRRNTQAPHDEKRRPAGVPQERRPAGVPQERVRKQRVLEPAATKHTTPKAINAVWANFTNTQIKAQEPEAQAAPVVEEPVVEEPQPVVEEPVVEEPQPVVEEPVVEEPKPVVEEPVVEEPKPVVEEPVVEEPKPVVEEPVKPVSKPKQVLKTKILITNKVAGIALQLNKFGTFAGPIVKEEKPVNIVQQCETIDVQTEEPVKEEKQIETEPEVTPEPEPVPEPVPEPTPAPAMPVPERKPEEAQQMGYPGYYFVPMPMPPQPGNEQMWMGQPQMPQYPGMPYPGMPVMYPPQGYWGPGPQFMPGQPQYPPK